MTASSAETPIPSADNSLQPELADGPELSREAKTKPLSVEIGRDGPRAAILPTSFVAGPSAGFGIHFDDVVSGQFDEDESGVESAPVKRVLAPLAETPKLHKVLAQAGMGSRLEMEQLILEGRITVNNEPAHIGQRIQFGDHVKVNGKPIRFRIEAPPARVIAYHKPVGEVVTHDDPQNRPTVFRRLPKLFQGKWQSVGRLDLNTEGLLLFTSSGELANNLMHPRFGLEREYAVRVLGALNKEEKQKLLDGVKLDDGFAQFGSIEAGGGEGSNCWYRVTISEGRNREVRRMFEAVGHAVSRLIRIRYGAMVLPRGLKRGAWMELDEVDIKSLVQIAGPRSDGSAVDANDSKRTGSDQDPSQKNRRRGVRGSGPRSSGSGQRSAPSGSPKLGGRGRGNRQDAPDRQGGVSRPDPMKTAFGYIGADSFTRQREDQGSRRPGAPGVGGQRRAGRGR
jgi:23S rRNA pseudouridine2605 synthase